MPSHRRKQGTTIGKIDEHYSKLMALSHFFLKTRELVARVRKERTGTNL